MSSPYPEAGQVDWYAPLKAYIDDQLAASPGGGGGGVASADAVIVYDTGSGTYPLRNTVSTGIHNRVVWVGPTKPPTTSGYALVEVDTWQKRPVS